MTLSNRRKINFSFFTLLTPTKNPLARAGLKPVVGEFRSSSSQRIFQNGQLVFRISEDGSVYKLIITETLTSKYCVKPILLNNFVKTLTCGCANVLC